MRRARLYGTFYNAALKQTGLRGDSIEPLVATREVLMFESYMAPNCDCPGECAFGAEMLARVLGRPDIQSIRIERVAEVGDVH